LPFGNIISSPANYLRYYCDAVGHWALIFPITNYQLPITGLHRYDKSLNGHDITYFPGCMKSLCRRKYFEKSNTDGHRWTQIDFSLVV